ncbi:MAG TPA: Holliday junction resolvase RuvX [Elusimicrobia bacterium]|nr:Holliday junction resolvase RuvX [Elusimicrobiota bacterium]
MQGRILAIDYGEKILGLALSDLTGKIAQPAGRIVRDNLTSDLKNFLHLIKENEVKEIVVGLPKSLDGSLGEKAKETITFAEELKKFLSEQGLSLPIVFWDERLTTKEVEKVLLRADLSRKKRKGVRDQLAACLILQNYLGSVEKSSTDTDYTDF